MHVAGERKGRGPVGLRPWISWRRDARWGALLLSALLVAAPGIRPGLAAQDMGTGTGKTPDGTVGTRPWASLGPLHAEEYVPLARLGSTPIMEGASTLPSGALEASVTLAYGNQFQSDSSATHDLQVDLERLLTAVDVRWGVTDGVEVAGRLSFETTGGGFLDGFIDRFHDVLGVNEPTREQTPRNRYLQRLRDGTGATVVEVPARGFTLEEVRLRARWRILGRRSSGAALTIRGGVRIPAADNTVGDEAPEASLSVLARVALGRMHLHGMVGSATVAGAPEIPERRRAQMFGAVAAEVGLSRSVAAVVQAGLGTSRLRNFSGRAVDGPRASLLAGLRGRHGRWGWQAGFQEDLPGWGSSADFTLLLGVSRRW